MNMKKRVMDIYRMPLEMNQKHIAYAMKIRWLNDVLLDCYLEMEAQDQNMHPEIKHNLAEGFRLAKNYLRILNKE